MRDKNDLDAQKKPNKARGQDRSRRAPVKKEKY